MTMDSHSTKEEGFTLQKEETSAILMSTGRPHFLATTSATTST
jgi:hypothetical protein